MKTALYVRCSTNKQDYESQIYRLEEWAKKLNKETILKADYGSGKKYDRKGIMEVLELARNQEISELAVVELSRIGRSISFIYKTIEELDKLNVKVVLIESNTILNPNTIEGRALLGGLALAADLEWQLIHDRNKRSREKIKRENIKLGRKRKEVSYRAIKALKDEGLGFRAIAKELGTSVATISRRYKDGHLSNVSKVYEKSNITDTKLDNYETVLQK